MKGKSGLDYYCNLHERLHEVHEHEKSACNTRCRGEDFTPRDQMVGSIVLIGRRVFLLS